jgi:hypothetical protein
MTKQDRDLESREIVQADEGNGGTEPQENEVCDDAVEHMFDRINETLLEADGYADVIIRWEVLTPYESKPGRWEWWPLNNGLVDAYHQLGATDCPDPWEHDLDRLPPADRKIANAEQSEELITNG